MGIFLPMESMRVLSLFLLLLALVYRLELPHSACFLGKMRFLGGPQEPLRPEGPVQDEGQVGCGGPDLTPGKTPEYSTYI